MRLTIHIDGGARGNPGPAAAGVSICDEDGTALFEGGFFLGRATNNVAEYTGLLKAVEIAKSIGGVEVDVHSDSELLVRQINGEYRVKNETLKDYFDQAMKGLRAFKKWRVSHVRREANRRADELANLAMDAGRDVIEYDFVRGKG
jgi:ribonuclease HI